MKLYDMKYDNTYELIKQGLKASNLRSKTIANNMANVNTKNYKKFSVCFEENLKTESESDLKLRRTSEKHISDKEYDYGENITITQDKSKSMREDGNNVDFEVEKVNQAANTLKYNALILNVNKRFNNLKMVIK